MIVLDHTLISDDVKEAFFVCDLNRCKGACCVEGDLGAPLEEQELETMEQIYPEVKSYLSPQGQEAIEQHDLLISPMALLELHYLFEIKRTAQPARVVLQSLQGSIGLEVCDLPFSRVVEHALDADWTRDPFDRLIVSHAAVRQAPLLTKDGHIHEHYPLALWE